MIFVNKWQEKYAGLIFDCDGTLIDSMPAHYVAWYTVMEKHGIEFPEDRFYALGGVPIKNIIELLANEAGKTLDIDQVAEEKENMFIEKMKDEAAPVKEVVEIAKQNLGVLPMAVASGSANWAIEIELKQFGIYDWFDAIVGCDDVVKHKPEPDVFLEAARRIGVDPRKCCAFEDSDIGIRAARSAGMDVIDVRELRKNSKPE